MTKTILIAIVCSILSVSCLCVVRSSFGNSLGNSTLQRTDDSPPVSPHVVDLLKMDNGTIQIGIDRNKGGAITWLSWNGHPKNIVNSIDPGRLIQQSYYAGKVLDRRSEGQSKSWSPWPWNPIQGGGVSSWARVESFKKLEDQSLYSETIPKLWDMPNEEAAALMRQWTSLEPACEDTISIRCEFESKRDANDRWGPAIERDQEIPACYFTRKFSRVKSYLGNGKWRDESQTPGPPWGKANPPLKAMAFLSSDGQGVAVFSPASTHAWNFGPHGNGLSEDPLAGPCMHVAPLERVKLGPESIYRFRYWLVVGKEIDLAKRLDMLWEKYSTERSELKKP